MKAVHVLADQEFQDADPLQPQQRHVSLGGPGVLKGGVELWGEPLLFHSPDAIGPPAAVGTEEEAKAEVPGSRRTLAHASRALSAEDEQGIAKRGSCVTD